MKNFFNYSKNRFLYSFLKLAILFLIGFLLTNTNVNAATYEYQIFGGVNDTEFTIASNGSKITTNDKFIFFGNTMNNYMYVDVCTTGYKPSAWVYDARDGSLSISTQVLKVNKPCSTQGHSADVYRFTFFVASASDIGQDRIGLNFTTRLFSDTDYTTYFRILSVFGSDTLSYADIESGQNEAIQQQQKEANETMKKVQEEQKKTNDLLTDDTSPNLDYDSMLGWLPAGPLDSLLNLPLTFFNSMLNGLGKKCIPVSVPIPYLDKSYQLPCITSLYAKIDGFGTFWDDIVGGIAGALILFSYFLKLYKWVDDTLTYRENNHIDNWGGV